MALPANELQSTMEYAAIPGTALKISRVGLGTWAMGGWMWGGTDEAAAITTLRSAAEYGITLIDTAPVYGFGRSEEIVGKAFAQGGRRGQVALATKVGLAGGTASPTAMPAARASCRRSTSRAGASRPMSSTSTTCIGRILWSPSRRPPRPWASSWLRARSGPSG